jgi:hypothetical protein
MSLIEDVHSVFQDLVAPELKSLNARIDGLEKTVDAKLATMNLRISSLERETDLRFLAAEERAAARHELILARLETFAAKIDARFESMDQKWNARFEMMDQKWDARFDAIEKRRESDRTEILRAIDTDKRLAALETLSIGPAA